MKSKIKTDLLKRLILNLHFEGSLVPNIHHVSKNKLIRNINSFQLISNDHSFHSIHVIFSR